MSTSRTVLSSSGSRTNLASDIERERDDLVFRLKLYRMAKEGAAFLRARLEEQPETWWAYEHHRARKPDPQQRLPIGRP